MTNSSERDQALGQLVLHKRRLAQIHKQAGLLLGAIYSEVDTIVGEDFMDKDLALVKDNASELIRLQNEAKILNKKIDAIQARYNFDDLDLD